jgi:hypothetical protein
MAMRPKKMARQRRRIVNLIPVMQCNRLDPLPAGDMGVSS